MAISSCNALQLSGQFQSRLISHSFNQLKTSVSSNVKLRNTYIDIITSPFFKELQQFLPMKVDVSRIMKNTSGKMLDAVVDSLFQFVDVPSLPSQKNFLPVEEIGELVEVTCTSGEIPADFAEGVFIRNGSNPLFGGLKSAVSIFGESHNIWVEGEGMLHAVYFKKDDDCGSWIISYKNKYVETETFKMEIQRNKPGFLPALAGNALAVTAAFLLNTLRFGVVIKHMSNTNVFEHSGRVYSIAENYLPQEVDLLTLETTCDWDVNGIWDRPFTSHPKKAPTSGELVVMGTDAWKPYYVLGVISADGKKAHKVDLKFKRSVFSHDIGVTEQYNVILDHPLTLDMKRLTQGDQIMKYVKEEYARIGVMPRYGDAESIKWFEVQANCTLHFLNCFEDADQVIVRGCRALTSVISDPDGSLNNYEWFSKGFNFAGDHDSADVGYLFTHLYEWRLNMLSGEVEERNLTGTEYSMDFPFINEQFTGLKHKYGYTQVIDSRASSLSGMAKFGSLAKLYLEESNATNSVEGMGEELNKVEYHKFEDNNFCSGSVFVPRNGGLKEDDGWIITFVHSEETDVTQVHIIDAQNFEGEAIAKLTLPQRVPYGFHGTFLSMPARRS